LIVFAYLLSVIDVTGPVLQQACDCGEFVLLFNVTLDFCNDRYN